MIAMNHEVEFNNRRRAITLNNGSIIPVETIL
jgi:hypothetical protein